MEFVMSTLNYISEKSREPYIYPVLLLLTTIIIFIIYQRFYSMSCDNDGCMKWECNDPEKEFEHRLFSKSGFGIAKSVIFSIIVFGFIGIILTFIGQLSSTGGEIFSNMVEYRPKIISFTFSVGFIYFLLVWWTRNCGLDASGVEIPVVLKCDGNIVEWEQKYTKISGLLIFLILFFSFLEIWNILVSRGIIKDNWSDQSWNQLEIPVFKYQADAHAYFDHSDNMPKVQTLPKVRTRTQSLPAPTVKTWLREEKIPSGGQKRARGKYKSKK